MNLGALQVAIDRRTGLAIDPAAQIDFINEALGALSSERDWPWLDGVATFTGDGTTTNTPLPATWERTRYVMVGTEFEALPTSIADLDRWTNYEDRPSIYGYAVENGELIIKDAPPSTATVTHRYVKAEPALASASDTPLVPARFHGYLVAEVARMELERVGDNKKAQAFIDDVTMWRGRMKDEMSRTRRPRRVRVRDGFGL